MLATAGGRCLLDNCEYIQFMANVNRPRRFFRQAWYKAAGRRLCLMAIAAATDGGDHSAAGNRSVWIEPR